jgi:hypothetical protein
MSSTVYACKSPGNRRNLKTQPRQRMALERLEDRLTPADIAVATLLFRGDLSGTGPVFSSAQGASIQVGFAPTQGEDFRPLATLTGETVVDTSAQTLQFKGTAGYLAGQSNPVDFWSSGALSTFNIQNMVTSGEAIAGSGFSVAGWTYTADLLKFENPDGGSTADSRLATQGAARFLGLAGLQADVRDTNFVRMAPEGTTLTGVSTKVAGGSFTAGGATFTSDGITIGYAPATETFSAYGSAKVSFGSNSITATLGDAAKPGLVISSGSITNFSASLAGSFALAGGTAGAGKLNMAYDFPTDTLRLTGAAAVSFSGSSGSLGLTGAGLIIRAGAIDGFQATFTGSATLAGASVSIANLSTTYSASQQSLSITGTAGLSFAGNTASVALGGQGLVIRQGTVQSFDATLNGGSFSAAGAALSFSGIGVYYSKENSEFSLSNGKASFSFGSNSASVALGQRGLVVKNGQLDSVDANFNGSIAIAGASLDVTSLAFKYTRATDEFRMGGAVRLAFDGFNLDASLAADNGLVIKSGAVESIDAKVNGSVTIAGASVSLTDGAVTYSRAADRLTVKGALALAYEKNNFSVALRNDGLVIEGGSIVSLDGVANGKVAIAGCQAVVDNLSVAYTKAANRLQLTGGASVSVGESSVAFDFLADKGGLVIENGALASVAATAKGVVVIDGTSVTLNAGVTYDAAGSLLELSGGLGLSLSNGDTFSAEGLVRIQNSAVAKVQAKVSANFKVAGITIQANNLSFSYESTGAVTGIRISTPATTEDNPALKVVIPSGETGQPDTEITIPSLDVSAGIRISNGALESFTLDCSGAFTIKGLAVKNVSASISYSSEENTVITIQGGADVKFGAFGITATLGRKGTDNKFISPGIKLVNGEIDTVDVTVTGELKLGNGFTLASADAGITYIANGSYLDMQRIRKTGPVWGIYGKLNPLGWKFLPVLAFGTKESPGILIHAGDLLNNDPLSLDFAARYGIWNISGMASMTAVAADTFIDLNGDSDWQPGETLLVDQNGDGKYTPSHFDISARARITLPFLGRIYASISFDTSGGLKDISVSIPVRKPIPGTPMVMTALAGTVENLDNPSALSIKAQVGMSLLGTDTLTSSLGKLDDYYEIYLNYQIFGRTDIGVLLPDVPSLPTVASAHFTGEVAYSPGRLVITAKAWLFAASTRYTGNDTFLQADGNWTGLVEATGKVYLDWGNSRYYASLNTQTLGGLFRANALLGMDFANDIYVMQAGATFDVEGTALDFAPFSWITPIGAQFIVLISPEEKFVGGWFDTFLGPGGVGYDFIDRGFEFIGGSRVRSLKRIAESITVPPGTLLVPLNERKFNTDYTFNYSRADIESASGVPLDECNSITLSSSFLAIDNLAYERTQTNTNTFPNFAIPGATGTNGVKTEVRTAFSANSTRDSVTKLSYTILPARYSEETIGAGRRKGTISVTIYPFMLVPTTDYNIATGELTSAGRAKVRQNANKTFNMSSFFGGDVANIVLSSNTPALIINDAEVAKVLTTPLPALAQGAAPVTPTWLKIGNKNYSIDTTFPISYPKSTQVINPDTGAVSTSTETVNTTPAFEMSVIKNVTAPVPSVMDNRGQFVSPVDHHTNTISFSTTTAPSTGSVGQQTTASLLFASQAEAAKYQWQAIVDGNERLIGNGIYQATAVLYQDDSISTTERYAGQVTASSDLESLVKNHSPTIIQFVLASGANTRPGQSVLYIATENGVNVVRKGVVQFWDVTQGSNKVIVKANVLPDGADQAVDISLDKLKPARLSKARILLQRGQQDSRLSIGSAFTASLVDAREIGSATDYAVFRAVERIVNEVVPALSLSGMSGVDKSRLVLEPLPAGVVRQVNARLATATKSEIDAEKWLFKTLNSQLRAVTVTGFGADSASVLPAPIGSEGIPLYRTVQGSYQLGASTASGATGVFRWEEDKLPGVPQFGFVRISDGINPPQFSSAFPYTPTPALTGSVNLAIDNGGKAPISGLVAYVDANGNRERDSSETFTTTDSNGQFSFYNLIEGQKSNLAVMLPGGTNYRALGSGADLSDPVIRVTVGQGAGPEFVLENLGAIYRGRVVIDTNGNGAVDATDEGAGNVSLRLSITNGTDTKQLNTLSDNQGLYLFEIPAGYRSVGRPQVASNRPELGIFVPDTTMANPTGIVVPVNAPAQPKLVEDDIIASKVLTITLDGLGATELTNFFTQLPAAFVKLQTGEFNAVSIRLFGFRLLIDSFEFYAPNTAGITGLKYASGWAFFGKRDDGEENQVRFTLGDNQTGGLALKAGRLQGFQLSLEGSIHVAGVEVEVTGLSARFDAGQNTDGSDGFFQLVGQASASYQNFALALALAGDGLIVDAQGVRTFTGTLTGSIPIAGQKVELGTLAMNYDRADDSLTFSGSSQWTMLGDKNEGNYFGLDNIALKIGLGNDPSKGAGVRSLSANLAGGFKLEGVDFDVSNLSFAWLPSSDAFSISGTSTLKTGDKALELTAQLPGDGLVFSKAGVSVNAKINGKLKLGASGYTVSVSDSGMTYSDGKLGFLINGSLTTKATETNGNTTQDELLTVSGSAYIQAGKLESLSAKAGGKIRFSGAVASFQDISAAYDGSKGAITLSGKADLSLEETGGKTERIVGIGGAIMIADNAVQALSASVSTGEWNPAPWLGLSLTGLAISYDRNQGRFGLSGACDLTIQDDKVGISLPGNGLVWENGSFRSFNAGLTGSITLQKDTEGKRISYLEASGASLGYDTVNNKVSLGGSYKGVFGSSAGGQLTIGSAGIVVDANGVQSFDASVSAVANFGEDFEDKDGDFIYNPSRDGKYTDANGNGQYDFGFGIRFQDVGLVYTRSQTNAGPTIAIKGMAVAAFSPEFLGSGNKGQGVAIDLSSPGIVVADGKLTDFSFGIAVGFNIQGLKLSQASLGARWLSSTREVAAWGSAGLSVDGKFKGIDLGTSAAPGIRVIGGVLTEVNAAMSGSIDLGDVSVSLAGAGLSYKAAVNGPGGIWGLYGSASVKLGIEVSTSLGNRENPGITLDTTNPDNIRLSLNNLVLTVSPFTVGGVGFQETRIAFSKSGDSFSASFTTGVIFNGWGLSGRFALRNGKISEVTVLANVNIPIPQTPVVITSLAGSITNIDSLDLSQITLTARVGMDIGGKISVNIPGKSDLLELVNGDYSALHVEGTARISASGLTMIADAYLGAKSTGTGFQQVWKGYLGEGTAKLDLNWARNTYTAGVRIDLARGLFRVAGTMSLANSTGLVLQATAAMRVPDDIPVLGGSTLASANFLLQIIPGQKAVAIGYGEIVLLGQKGVKCDFLTGKIGIINGSEISKALGDAGISRSLDTVSAAKPKPTTTTLDDTGYATLSAAFSLSRSESSGAVRRYSGQSQPVPEAEVSGGIYRVSFQVGSARDRAAYSSWKNRLTLTAAAVPGVRVVAAAQEFDATTGIGSIGLTVTPLPGQYLPRGMVLFTTLSSPVVLTRTSGSPNDPLEANSEWTRARSYSGAVPAIGTDENGTVISGLDVTRAKYVVTFKPNIAPGESLPADWLDSLRVYASEIAGTTVQVDRPTYDAVNNVGAIMVTYFPNALPRVPTNQFTVINNPSNPSDFITKGLVPRFTMRSKVALAGFSDNPGGTDSSDVSASWWTLPLEVEKPYIPAEIGSAIRTTTLQGKVHDPRTTSVNVSLYYSLDEAGDREFPATLADGQSAVEIPVDVRPDGTWVKTISWDPSRLPEGPLWLYGLVSDEGPIPPVYGQSAPFTLHHDIIGKVTSLFSGSGSQGSGPAAAKPLAGIRVYLDLNASGTPDNGEPVAITGDDGGYTIDAPYGVTQTTVVFDVPNHFEATQGNPLAQVINLGAGQVRADLQLAPEFDLIRGQVRVAGRLGQPVSGLPITATAPDGSLLTVITDQSGFYEFPAELAGTYTISPAFAGATWNRFEIRAAAGWNPLLESVTSANRQFHDMGVIPVESVGIVRSASGNLTTSLPALVNSANEGYVTRIEFDPSLRGKTIHLQGSLPTAIPRYLVWSPDSNGWESYPSAPAVLPDLSLEDTYRFGPTVFRIGESLAIDGGSLGITLQGDGASRGFLVRPGGSLSLSNISLNGFSAVGTDGTAGTSAGPAAAGGAGGGGAGLGGAILNRGQLVLRGVTLAGNSAKGGAGGSVNLPSAGRVSPEVNLGGDTGGAAGARQGAAAGAGGGQLGGLPGTSSSVSFTYSLPGSSEVFQAVTAIAAAGGGGSGLGGAIYNDVGATTIISDNSRFVGNNATGGKGGISEPVVANPANAQFGDGALTLSVAASTGTTDPNGRAGSGLGGGIYNAGGVVIVTGSLFEGNSSSLGAAVYGIGGRVGLVSSTLRNNAGAADGGLRFRAGDDGMGFLQLTDTVIMARAGGPNAAIVESGTVVGINNVISSRQGIAARHVVGAAVVNRPLSPITGLPFVPVGESSTSPVGVPVTMRAVAVSPLVGAFRPFRINVSITDGVANRVPGGRVILALNGVEVASARLPAGGSVVFAAPGLPPGTQAYRVYYEGDALFAGRVATVVGRSGTRGEWLASKLFQVNLARQGSVAEIRAWGARIDAGLGLNDAVRLFRTSTEAARKTVSDAYQDLLGRVADTVGMRNWIAFLRTGKTEAQLRAAIMSLPEYRSNHTRSQAIDEVYDTLLGQPASEFNKQYWLVRLQSGADIRTVTAAVESSLERRTRIVDSLYSEIYGRNPGLDFSLRVAGTFTSGSEADAVEARLLNAAEQAR